MLVDAFGNCNVRARRLSRKTRLSLFGIESVESLEKECRECFRDVAMRDRQSAILASLAFSDDRRAARSSRSRRFEVARA